MEFDRLLFWMALCGLAPLLLNAGRSGFKAARPALLGGVIVVVFAGIGFVAVPDRAGTITVLAWLVFLIAPRFLLQIYGRRVQQRRLGSAWRWATVLSIVYPLSPWGGQKRLLTALAAEERGDLNAAHAALLRLQDERGIDDRMRLIVNGHLLRLDRTWGRLIEILSPYNVAADPWLLPLLIRALGENGRFNELLGLLRVSRVLSGATQPYTAMIALAFCGRSAAVARLLQGPLRWMRVEDRAYWRATTGIAAGGTWASSALVDLERQCGSGSAKAQRLARERLRHLPATAPDFDSADLQVIADLEREPASGRSRESPARRLRRMLARAPVIAGIVAVTFAVFIAELLTGGSENEDTLYRLGALWPRAVTEGGEWWRLVTPLFLHFGWLHIGLNMLALAVIGARVEASFGSWRTLLVYLGSGIGSTATVLVLVIVGVTAEDLLVGASGAIFGLVGAQIALLVRDWRRHRSRAAIRGLQDVGLAILLQAGFDLSTPEISFSGHVSGLAIGTVLTALLMLIPTSRRVRSKALPVPERGRG